MSESHFSSQFWAPAQAPNSAPVAALITPQTASAEAGAPGPSSRLDSAALLRGHKAVEINHNGSTYLLQSTRLGKLILTK